MPHVHRELRQERLHVAPLAVPGDETPDRERMPEVVDVQAAALCRDSGILAKPVEDVAHVVVPDGGPVQLREQRSFGINGHPGLSPPPQELVELPRDGPVVRDEPRLVELRLADRRDVRCRVDILQLQRQGLADAEPERIGQQEDRPDAFGRNAGRPVPTLMPGREQPPDLVVREDVRPTSRQVPGQFRKMRHLPQEAPRDAPPEEHRERRSPHATRQRQAPVREERLLHVAARQPVRVPGEPGQAPEVLRAAFAPGPGRPSAGEVPFHEFRRLHSAPSQSISATSLSEARSTFA